MAAPATPSKRNATDSAMFVASQPPPAENGEPFHMKMDSVEIEGMIGMVGVTDRYLSKRFADLLLLLKTDDRWRIHNKAWHAEPS